MKFSIFPDTMYGVFTFPQNISHAKALLKMIFHGGICQFPEGTYIYALNHPRVGKCPDTKSLGMCKTAS